MAISFPVALPRLFVIGSVNTGDPPSVDPSMYPSDLYTGGNLLLKPVGTKWIRLAP
jgi:hypothetical protein